MRYKEGGRSHSTIVMVQACNWLLLCDDALCDEESEQSKAEQRCAFVGDEQ